MYEIVQLSEIYGNVNELHPQAMALGLSWFTAINPLQLQYITITYF